MLVLTDPTYRGTERLGEKTAPIARVSFGSPAAVPEKHLLAKDQDL